MNFFCRLLLIWVSSASFQQSAANEWNQFRGPNGSGVLEGARPPIRFDGQDPTWHQAIPSGHASPVLWGQRLFLTGLEEGLLQTLCLDTRSGHLLWKQQAPKVTLASHQREQWQPPPHVWTNSVSMCISTPWIALLRP